MSDQSHTPEPALLDLAAVLRITTLRRSNLYRRIAAGAFPRPHKIGQLSRWRRDEVYAWIEQVAPRSREAV